VIPMTVRAGPQKRSASSISEFTATVVSLWRPPLLQSSVEYPSASLCMPAVSVSPPHGETSWPVALVIHNNFNVWNRYTSGSISAAAEVESLPGHVTCFFRK